MKKFVLSILVFTFSLLAVNGRQFSAATTKNLERFQGYLNTGKVTLNWSVLDNDLVDQFEVEKSTDGTAFHTAAFVLSSDKSGGENYQFLQPVNSTIVYYRLKMTGNTGRITYSMILAFKPSSSREFNLKVLSGFATSKIADNLTISFEAAKQGPVTLTIIDMTGRPLVQKTFQSFKGTNQVSIPVRLVTTGVYIAAIYDGEKHNSTEFLK